MNAIIHKTAAMSKNDLIMKRACLIVFCLVIASSVMYGILINKTIGNVVARQKAQAEISALNSRVALLETEHISLKTSITPDKARELGFVDVPNPQYVSYNQSGNSLSFNSIR